jgi:hypothetical protein
MMHRDPRSDRYPESEKAALRGASEQQKTTCLSTNPPRSKDNRHYIQALSSYTQEDRGSTLQGACVSIFCKIPGGARVQEGRLYVRWWQEALRPTSADPSCPCLQLEAAKEPGQLVLAVS